jgi:undecaprenyl-diphosphatase
VIFPIALLGKSFYSYRDFLMMVAWKYLALGAVQGVTEWLPVSSSGHLVFLQHFWAINEHVAFDALVHFASLLVVAVVFWKDIAKLLLCPFFSGLSEHRRLLGMLAIGSVPIAVCGLVFSTQIRGLFGGFSFLAYTFLLTSILLLLSRVRVFRNIELNPSVAFAIGIAQALALLPGVSRSGATLSIGLMLGLRKKEAARFAFLLAVPALFGAFALEAPKAILHFEIGFAIGFLAAFVVGVCTLRFLLGVIQKGRLHNFALWTAIMSGLVLMLAL